MARHLRLWWDDEFREADFPRNPLIGDNLLDAGEKMIIYGPSEAGKSYLVLQLAVALANGEDFLGFPVMHKCRVLLVQSELSMACYQERYKKMVAGYPSLTLGVMTVEDLKLDEPENREAFEELVLEAEPDVVIFDPFRAFFSGDENGSDSVEQFFTSLAASQTEPPFTFIYVHHVRKSSPGGDSEDGSKASARGTGLITDRPSTALSLTVNASQTKWNLSFTKTRNRERHPESIALVANYRTGKFDIHNDLDPTTVYVLKVMEILDKHEMRQTDLINRIKGATGCTQRLAYIYIDRAEQRGLITRRQLGGQGNPHIVTPVIVKVDDNPWKEYND